MQAATAIFALLFGLSAGCIFLVWWAGARLMVADKQREFLIETGWFALRGLLIPWLVWAFFNSGLLLQPITADLQAAQNSAGGKGPAFVRLLGTGLFVVSSYWSGLAMIWLISKVWRDLEEEPRMQLRSLAWTSCLALCIPVGILVLVGGWPTVGLACLVIGGAISGYAPGIVFAKKAAPMYAKAIGRIKFGKYAEAESEIFHQLEKCESDFDGWMLLAELYATRYNDLAEAERTILETCDDPETGPSQLAVAMQKLADWQLKLAQDPEAARRCLQMIITRIPGSHLAHMAQLRMNQIPRTKEEYLEQSTSSAIPLPALGDKLEEDSAGAGISKDAAAKLANECVARLRADPNDISAREKLARTAVESLGQWELGIEQVDLLLEMPNQPARRRAEWLSWQAAWFLKYAGNEEKAMATMERLIGEHPGTPQAFAAAYRLRKLKGEYLEPPR